MEWDLPKYVELNGMNEDNEICRVNYKIRNDCDYRIVLDVINALNDSELDEQNRLQCALFIFYDDLSGCADIETAAKEMMKIINCGEEIDKKEPEKPKIMDWEKDFKNIAAPISKALGYSVRDEKNYTHWYDFIGAYYEIGECYWSQVMNIRKKRQEGRPLDETDRKFYREHKKDIDLPMEMSDDEREWLNEDW